MYKLYLVSPTRDKSGVVTHIQALSKLILDDCLLVQCLYPSQRNDFDAGEIKISYSVAHLIRNWSSTNAFLSGLDVDAIIHLHGRLTLFAFLPAIVLRRKRFAYTFHEYFSKNPTLVERVKINLEIFLARMINHRISVSQSLQLDMSNHYNIDTVYIPNWISAYPIKSIKSPNVGRKQTTLIFVGRFSEEKNPMLAIRAVHQMIQQGSHNIELKMFGYGPLQSDMEIYVKSNSLTDKIKLCGVSEMVLQEMQNADCLIISSKSESFGLVYLEALVAGIPAIVPDIPGLNEVVAGSHVERFEPDNIDSLINSIHSFIETDKQVINEHINADRRLILGKYDTAAVVEKYQEFYGALSKDRVVS